MCALEELGGGGLLCCLGGRVGGMWAVPEGPVHHLCWITICLEDLLIGERNHLKQVFQANGYPAQMVNRTLRNRPHAPHSSTQTAEQTTTPKFLHLPYVRGVSERIERKCRHLGIRTTFKSKGTLREALVQTKDPQP